MFLIYIYGNRVRSMPKRLTWTSCAPCFWAPDVCCRTRCGSLRVRSRADGRVRWFRCLYTLELGKVWVIWEINVCSIVLFTWGMSVPFEVGVEQFERLGRKRCAPFSLFRRLDANEVGQMVLAGFVAVPMAMKKIAIYYYISTLN